MINYLGGSKKRLKQVTIYLMAFIMLLTPLGIADNQVKAAGYETQEAIMERELELFFEKVVVLDSNGVESIDLIQLEKYFGSEVVNEVTGIAFASGPIGPINGFDDDTRFISIQASSGSFTSCMKSALLDYLGVSAVQVLITGGVWKLLEKKAYKEAAKLAIKLGVGTNAVALAATFMFYGGKCAYKFGIW